MAQRDLRPVAPGPSPSRGVRLVFGATARRLRQLHAVAELERRCCAFLEFGIEVTPGGGALTLDVTGPDGTEQFLETLLEQPRAA